MAEANRLEVEIRTEFGKGASRRTRREGKVPAVLYGHGAEPQHLSLQAREFAAVLRNKGTNAVLTLNIGGTDQLALVKEISVHPIRPVILHTDLLSVKLGEKVSVTVPIVLTGDAAPGTLVSQDANAIAVLASALSIPEQIEVSVEGLEAGSQILAEQLTLPEGVELEADAGTLIVNVTEETAAETETEAEAEAAEAAETAEAEAPESE